jgi:hypothetical protein
MKSNRYPVLVSQRLRSRVLTGSIGLSRPGLELVDLVLALPERCPISTLRVVQRLKERKFARVRLDRRPHRGKALDARVRSPS